MATVRSRRWVMIVWACFLARLLFYSAMLPLWEGYDEWAHFAVVRRVAAGELLVARTAPIPRDVEASLGLAPVPWELRSLPASSVTRDDYWELSGDERARRESQLNAMPATWGREDGIGPLAAYEALQPPLYYWLMAPALWLLRGVGLLGQVLALRILSSLVASLAIPLVYLVGLEVWNDSGPALGAAAIVAVMPGLALDVARVGNDCLAVVLFTLFTWLLLRNRRQLATGAALGLGLLTKAYFLTAIPALLFRGLAWKMPGRGALSARTPSSRSSLGESSGCVPGRADQGVGCGPGGPPHNQRRRSKAGAWMAAGIGVLLAGWWYVRNLRTTGTLAGLSESLMVRGASVGEMARQALRINWLKAIDAILLSHLYFGGWSSLTVRSWMYHLFYLVAAVGAIGVLRLLRRRQIRTLVLVYLCFWAGQFYNVVLLYMSKGLGGSMGWYMYAVVGAEVVLCLAGLRALAPLRASRWMAAAGAFLFALLDLYTVHAVAIPYYTGMIRHRANGALGALHAAGWHAVGMGGAVTRLAVFVPPALLIALWLAYLAGTVGAVVCACARECDSGAQSQSEIAEKISR